MSQKANGIIENSKRGHMETNTTTVHSEGLKTHKSNKSSVSSVKNLLIRRGIGAAIVVAVIALGAFTVVQFVAGQKPADDRYQAVFLDNGQVFFGKLKNTGGRYLTLEKAFYTQKADIPDTATPEQQTATDNNVKLIKVGDEVYGPENVMQIRSEQVLFWQDLKSDSKVAKAIDSAS